MRRRKTRGEKAAEKGTGDGLSVLDLSARHLQERNLAGAAEKGRRAGPGTGNFRKKVLSDALAVHPDQIPEAREEARKRGVAVPEFLPDGRCVFDNSAHFRRYAKAHGFRHRGYF